MNETQMTEEVRKLLMGLLPTKNSLTTDEVAEFTGFSKSTIYKLVQKNKIPYSKPTGKQLFFDREKIEDWLLGSQNKTKRESQREAQKYILNKKRKAF